MSKRSLAIAIMVFVAGVVSTPAYAWQADRLDLSVFWIITCNDGYAHGGNYGANGPDFSTGFQLCAGHGGIAVVQPPIGTLTLFALTTMAPIELISPISVGNLFSVGQLTAGDAITLTGSSDQLLWSTTLLSFNKVPDPGSFNGVGVFGVAVDLTGTQSQVPEPASFGLLVVGLTAFGLIRLHRCHS